ncbi:hypothetical protein BDV97DRAFT_106388 [Delphinella strobiligena]|nr:hypothetical protein BDV97DRAFT_106388 [Delphinella strobiligena]
MYTGFRFRSGLALFCGKRRTSTALRTNAGQQRKTRSISLRTSFSEFTQLHAISLSLKASSQRKTIETAAWQVLSTAELDALKGQPAGDIDDLTFRHAGVENLMRKGYINEPNLPSAPYFPNDQVNPIWQHANFVLPDSFEPIPTSLYNTLLPVLKLATRILENVYVRPFFIGLLTRPLERLNTPDAMRKGRKPLRKFTMSRKTEEHVAGHSRSENLYVEQAFQQLAATIKWQFGGNPDTTLMTTYPVDIGRGKRSQGSRVYIDKMFYAILRGQYTAHDCTRAGQAKLDRRAAMMRTRAFMAVALCHEVCHAIDYIAPDDPEDKDRELYFGNDRLDETGCAFQQQIMSGYWYPIGSHPFSLTCAYGMFIKDFPGANRTGPVGSMLELGSPARYGVFDEDAFPVSMAYIKQLFQEDFWDRSVAQYGLKKLRAERRLGYALHRDLQLKDDEVNLVPLPLRTSRFERLVSYLRIARRLRRGRAFDRTG